LIDGVIVSSVRALSRDRLKETNPSMIYSVSKASDVEPTTTLDSAAAISHDRFLTRREASEYLAILGLRLAPATLAKLFCTRSDGPPVRHFGRHPKYQAGALRAWALARLSAPRRSSSEPGVEHNNG
jgi:hypothetical protein